MKGSTWITVFLIAALGVVGYLWFASTNNPNQLARDMNDNNNTNNTPNQVGQNTDIGTNPAGQLSDVATDIRGEDAKKCEDCHKPGGDYSLSNEAKNIEGHPPVNSDDVNTCLKCHTNESKDYAFRYVLHTAHLSEDDSTFVTRYNGRCTTCHQMQENGKIAIPGINEG